MESKTKAAATNNERDAAAGAPAPQVSPPNTPIPQTATLELASKLLAVLLFSVYAFGFLITSVHASSYGFTIVNPLRPKILAAGAWFLVFLGVPAMLAVSISREVFAALEKRQWSILAQWGFYCYSSCVLLGLVAFPLFDFPESVPPVKFSRPDMVEAGIWALIALIVAVTILAKSVRPHIRLAAILIYFGTTLYWSASAVLRLPKGEFNYFHITVWLFAFLVLALVEMRYKHKDLRHMAMAFPLILMILGCFARYYYPRIQSSWGGGSPVSVVLYLSQDAPVAAGKQVPALLLDESDAGFYIVPAHESKAIFLPRSAVRLVFFADRTTDSPLLRSGGP